MNYPELLDRDPLPHLPLFELAIENLGQLNRRRPVIAEVRCRGIAGCL
jgi:hypothetical protein